MSCFWKAFSCLWKSLGKCLLLTVTIAGIALALKAQDADSNRPEEDQRARIRRATEQIKKIDMRSAGKEVEGKDTQNAEEVVELVEQPLLIFGDTVRLHENGTLWAFGKSGRPVAFIELFQGRGRANWSQAVTLTSQTHGVVMRTPNGTRWTPQKTQIDPALITASPAPAAKETVRLRQMKDLARRFTAHEFWDPDNSRFELRLLVQPVHRYSDAKAGLHDGTAFILAHGTNPELVLLIEALGEKLEASRWHFSLARSSSAELHVELDGKEVWKQDRTPGVVGIPTDPYWMF
ncbi:MAG: hypothetical protein WD894_01365 [Pirellulales bacterium]